MKAELDVVKTEDWAWRLLDFCFCYKKKKENEEVVDKIENI